MICNSYWLSVGGCGEVLTFTGPEQKSWMHLPSFGKPAEGRGVITNGVGNSRVTILLDQWM